MALGGAWVIVILIILAVLLVRFLIAKKQAFATLLATGITLFLVLSLGYVYISNDMDLNSPKDFVDGFKVYFSWLSSVFGNVKAVTSHATGLDWRLGNNNSTRVD